MNFGIIVSLCLLFSYDALCKDLRIIGGTTTTINEFPHSASFRFGASQRHFCGGSIVSEKHILTAAHCLFGNKTYFELIRVFTGSTTLGSNTAVTHRITSVQIHPLFTGHKTFNEMNNYDIAVVEVSPAIEFNEFTKKIDLPTSDSYARYSGFIAGWGVTKFPSTNFSQNLQKASMTILRDHECELLLPFKMHSTQFCAVNIIGIGPCLGDSGAGIVIAGKLIGIISLSLPCASGIPDLYTKIYSHLDFITNVINN